MWHANCKLCRALCKALALFSHLYSRTAHICTRCGTLTLGLDVAHRLWPAGGSGPACHHRSTTLTASVPSALWHIVNAHHTTVHKCVLCSNTRKIFQAKHPDPDHHSVEAAIVCSGDHRSTLTLLVVCSVFCEISRTLMGALCIILLHMNWYSLSAKAETHSTYMCCVSQSWHLNHINLDLSGCCCNSAICCAQYSPI